MKLLISAILASIASAAQVGRELQLTAAATALESRWEMDTPVIVYDADTNRFTLDFITASALNSAAGMEASFYDTNCKQDGTGTYTEVPLTAGIDAVGGGTPAMTMLGPGLLPQLIFEIDTQILAASSIYTLVTEAMVLAGDEVVADQGLGIMRMCVRSGLGYTTGTFQEVNFIESLITIKYDLTAGFDVAAFSVEPKERVETTEVKDSYELIAYLCDPNTLVPQTDPVRNLPLELSDYAPGSLAAVNAFNQGALITICVAPVDLTAKDGIVISELTDFVWSRPAPSAVTQAALPLTAANGLTSHDALACAGAGWCQFSSILFADFYISEGTVTGAGNANLAFARRRNLKGSVDGEDGRQLQEAAAASPFDVAVPVTSTDEGPGSLKTAGGAAFGFSALASAVALLSAVLLA